MLYKWKGSIGSFKNNDFRIELFRLDVLFCYLGIVRF